MTQSNEPSPFDRRNRNFVPLDAFTHVVKEHGRWVVYLDIPAWEPSDGESPVANDWKRINDYSSESDARVAASWYERSANRTFRPSTGF
tara:strand:+ start:72152 stop:72418 length:267 start_codon:yes stop_codon:yes gene_type:complete